MSTENIDIIKGEPEGTMLLRYIKGIASAEDAACVEAWLKLDAGNERVLLQVARLYHVDNTFKRIKARDAEEAFKILERRISKRAKFYWLGKVASVAASVAIIIGLSYFISHFMLEDSEVERDLITLESNTGVRTHFKLPDGTTVYLNSGSTLSYPSRYEDDERRVYLSGEAYFDVAHDAESPFIVSALDNKYNVRVLGTEFNVQAYENDNMVSTTLVNGSVNLEIKSSAGAVISKRLSPSEKAIFNLETDELSVVEADTEFDTAWMDGKLMFNDTPVREALKRLSIYYNVEFVIKDKDIEDYCLTGVLKNRPLTQALDYLKISSNIDYTIENETKDDSKGVNLTKVILYKGK